MLLIVSVVTSPPSLRIELPRESSQGLLRRPRERRRRGCCTELTGRCSRPQFSREGAGAERSQQQSRRQLFHRGDGHQQSPNSNPRQGKRNGDSPPRLEARCAQGPRHIDEVNRDPFNAGARGSECFGHKQHRIGKHQHHDGLIERRDDGEGEKTKDSPTTMPGRPLER